MAQFDDLTITNNGLNMIAESQAGAKLIFTKIKLGDGQITDQDVAKLNDIISEKMSTKISSLEKKTVGEIVIKFTVDNTELTSGFFVREIGIFAKINDGGEEKLYAYTNAGNYTNYLADKKTPIDAIVAKINLAVGNATNINFVLDKSVIYVTLEDLESNLQKHNTNADSHAEAFNKHNSNANTHEPAFNKHNADLNAHSDLFNKKLDKTGGTLTGDLNASGHNITATKFIGNLQGNADSATKANQDKNGKDITGYLYKTEDLTLNSNAEILTVGNISEILNSFCTKFKNIQGTASYGENSPTTLKSLNDNKAPKTSPAFSGTPTVPTPAEQDNSKKITNTEWVQAWVKTFVAELSNNLEVQTQEDGHFSCPALGITGLMAQNGYICLGKLFGGLILQWGKSQLRDKKLNLVYPVTFSKFNVVSAIHLENGDFSIDSPDLKTAILSIFHPQNMSCFVYTRNAITPEILWIAIGV